jgi:hypothetical protein
MNKVEKDRHLAAKMSNLCEVKGKMVKGWTRESLSKKYPDMVFDKNGFAIRKS